MFGFTLSLVDTSDFYVVVQCIHVNKLKIYCLYFQVWIARSQAPFTQEFEH